MKHLILIVALIFILIIKTSSSSSLRDPKNLKMKQEGKEVLSFLRTANVFKTIVNLFYGNDVEIRASLNEILSMVSKILDVTKMLLGHFEQRSKGLTKMLNHMVSSTLTMTQGYVKVYLAGNERCAQRRLCESSREAAHLGGDIGNIVAQIGGYVSSYLLNYQNVMTYNKSLEALNVGRVHDNCKVTYSDCMIEEDEFTWKFFS